MANLRTSKCVSFNRRGQFLDSFPIKLNPILSYTFMANIRQSYPDMRKHYTKPQFALALMKCIDFSPRFVLDPAVGGGALLRAAREEWAGAQLKGIDIDQNSLIHAREAAPHAQLQYGDALNASWIQKRHKEEGILIACNPPFSDQSRLPIHLRTDIRFLDKALSTASKNDLILFILPCSLAASPAFTLFREKLLRNHKLISAIGLPDNAFHKTEATAVAIVLQPWTPTANHQINFIELGKNAAVVHRIRTQFEKDSFRFDPSYYFRVSWIPPLPVKTIPLSTVIKDIRRGTFVSQISTRKPNSRLFLHTTDLRSGWFASQERRYVGASVPANVQRGCVLQSRVGNRLWEKSAMFRGTSPATASDCLYIMKAPTLIDSAYLGAFLTTKYAQAYIRSLARGLTAPILTKPELLNLPIPWLRSGLRKQIAQEWLMASSPSNCAHVTNTFNKLLLQS